MIFVRRVLLCQLQGFYFADNDLTDCFICPAYVTYLPISQSIFSAYVKNKDITDKNVYSLTGTTSHFWIKQKRLLNAIKGM